GGGGGGGGGVGCGGEGGRGGGGGGGGPGECGQRAVLDLPDRSGDRREHHLHVAGDHVLQRRPGALVWHVHDVDPGLRLEQLAGEVGGRAIAAGGEVDGARLRSGERDQLGQRLR